MDKPNDRFWCYPDKECRSIRVVIYQPKMTTRDIRELMKELEYCLFDLGPEKDVLEYEK